MSAKLQLLVAVFLAVVAGGIWVVFLRPVPLRSATGIITNKTFKPAGTYWQFPVGANRNFRAPTAIPTAEAYIFEVAADGFSGPVFYPLNTVASQAFDVGKRVQLKYQERGIPFIWKRVNVIDMTSE